MRFFLLGEALKKLLGKRTLIVVSITQEDKDKDLETNVKESVNLNFERLYYRITWNQLYSFIEKADVKDSLNRTILSRYLRGKTLGYDETGKLRTLLL